MGRSHGKYSTGRVLLARENWKTGVTEKRGFLLDSRLFGLFFRRTLLSGEIEGFNYNNLGELDADFRTGCRLHCVGVCVNVVLKTKKMHQPRDYNWIKNAPSPRFLMAQHVPSQASLIIMVICLMNSKTMIGLEQALASLMT